MAKGVVEAAILVGALAVGGGSILLSEGDIKASDGGVLDGTVEQSMELPTEADVATAFLNRGGKRVRIVGVQNDSEAVVENTLSGRGVVHQAEDLDVSGLQCHYVLEAPASKKFVEFDGGRTYHTRTPIMQNLEKYFGANSWPVEMSGSCVAGSCYWSATFKGQACLDIADSEFYVGSTMQEFLSLSPTDQARLLRTEGICDGEPCTVPVGDARATPGARVKVPHSWAQRADYNFAGSMGDVVDARFEVPQAEAEIIE